MMKMSGILHELDLVPEPTANCLCMDDVAVFRAHIGRAVPRRLDGIRGNLNLLTSKIRFDNGEESLFKAGATTGITRGHIDFTRLVI